MSQLKLEEQKSLLVVLDSYIFSFWKEGVKRDVIEDTENNEKRVFLELSYKGGEMIDIQIVSLGDDGPLFDVLYFRDIDQENPIIEKITGVPALVELCKSILK